MKKSIIAVAEANAAEIVSEEKANMKVTVSVNVVASAAIMLMSK